MGRKWNEDEKRLTREAKSEADLAFKYLQHFGECNKDRVHSLFSHRQRLLLEEQMLQKTIIATQQSEHKQVVFSDEVVLVNISNKLSELIQIQKETLELFRSNIQQHRKDTAA